MKRDFCTVKMEKPLFPESLGFVGKSGLMRFFAIQFACLCWNAAFSQRFSIPVFRCAETQNKEATCLSPSGFLCRNCTQTHAVRLQYHYIHGAWMRQTNSLDDVRRDSGCGCPWRWMEGVRRAGFGKKEGVPSCGWHPSRTPAKSLEKPRNIGLFVDLRYRIWYNMDCENLMPSSFHTEGRIR